MPLGTYSKKLLLFVRGQHAQMQQSIVDAEIFVIFSQCVTTEKSHLGKALSLQFYCISSPLLAWQYKKVSKGFFEENELELRTCRILLLLDSP